MRKLPFLVVFAPLDEYIRSSRALQISHPIPPTLSENSSTTNTITPTSSTSAISFHGHHHQHHHSTPDEHQSMPDPLMLSSYNESGCITPNGGDTGSVNSGGCEPKTSVSLPYVPSTSSTTSMASNSSSNNGSAHHRYVKNKLAQPKFPRTPFVKKHSAHTGGSSTGVVDVYSK